MLNRLIVGIGVLLLTACAGAAPPAAPVVLQLSAPKNNSSMPFGSPVQINGEALGIDAATGEVRVMINGSVHARIALTAAIVSEWMPSQPGSHVIHLEAVDAKQAVLARSDIVVVLVEAPAATPAPPASPTVPPAATAPLPTVAATLVVTAADIAPTAAPASIVITESFANVRGGPGLNYEILGQVKQGDTAPVTGKSADGQWWQITVNSAPVWVFAQLAQANAAAAAAPVVTAALPPTAAATAVGAPAATPALVPIGVSPTPVAPASPPTAIADAASAGLPPCNPDNQFWAVKIHKDDGYTFCTPVPIDFVNGNDKDQIMLRWHIYGIDKLELRIDPKGQGCGLGSTGMREWAPFKTETYVINRSHFPKGGYKIGLWATLADGRVQDWGELDFCGTK